MNTNEAWGLPAGSVRAILATILVLSTVAMAFTLIAQGVTTEGMAVLAVVASMASTAVTFYFLKSKEATR